MDLLPSAEQQALAAGVRSWAEGTWTPDALRAASNEPKLDRARWLGLAELGVLALRQPPDAGGLGLGVADAALVFEQLGRALVPGPLLAGCLAAGLAGGPVPGAADGSVLVGFLDTTREPLVLEYPAAADAVLVLGPDAVHLVPAHDLTLRPLEQPLDPLTPVARVEPLPAGQRLGGADLVAQLRAEGAVLTAALQVGGAQGSLDLALRYARQREQFGRPVGSFQAVKHLLADMLCRVELARSALYEAAVTLDGRGTGVPERTVAVAKLMADDAATANGRGCVQVHGGMGFTWEVLAHLYLKRAWLLAQTFGTADEHADTIGRTL